MVYDKLVILDLSGTLIHKYDYNRNATKPKSTLIYNKEFYQLIHLKNGRKITPCYGLVDFIESLMSKYRVAIWSSTTDYNTNPIIKSIFPKHIIERFLFIWHREFTELDPDYGKEGYEHIQKYDTIKPIDNIKASPIINYSRKWDRHNMIIIDDSPDKLRFNPPENNIVVPTYMLSEFDEKQTVIDLEYLNYLEELIDDRFELLTQN